MPTCSRQSLFRLLQPFCCHNHVTVTSYKAAAGMGEVQQAVYMLSTQHGFWHVG